MRRDMTLSRESIIAPAAMTLPSGGSLRKSAVVERKNWCDSNIAHYKYSSEDMSGNITGFESMNEVVVSRLLTKLGIAHVTYEACCIEYAKGNTRIRTIACKSYDYKTIGGTAVPLGVYCQQMGINSRLADNYLRENLGLGKQLDKVYLVDFLIRNVDRHGFNLELYRTPAGDITLAPLFDNGYSLFHNKRMLELWQNSKKSLLTDANANNYLGDSSLEANLKLIREPVIVHALTEMDYYDIVQNIKSWSTKKHAQLIMDMIKERYEYAKSKKVLIEG